MPKGIETINGRGNELTELKPKFKVGDNVINVHVCWSSKQIQCPDCLGTMKWKVTCPSKEEFEVDCNTCKSGWQCTGTVTEWGDDYTLQYRTIGSVRTDTGDEREPIKYMCSETGVGSGQIYPEKNLFFDRPEAEEYAKKEVKLFVERKQAEELASLERKKKDGSLYGRKKK